LLLIFDVSTGLYGGCTPFIIERHEFCVGTRKNGKTITPKLCHFFENLKNYTRITTYNSSSSNNIKIKNVIDLTIQINDFNNNY
tara:strand:- start:407 stop:658 length:252 start_codon:yes stop_codon:yes gene_type:complete